MENNLIDINSDDSDIIEAFRNGSETAFNVLIRKYHKKTYWIIRKMVIDHDDADDITQEVFIKLHSSLSSFRGESKFFTYLYKMAMNYSLNHLKKRGNELKRNVDTDSAEIPGQDPDFENRIDENERTRLLEDAISNLPEQQRAVFNMRYYDDLSYEEISKILQRSVGGMKANYFHAVKNIKKFLNSCKSKELFEGS